MGLSHKLNGEGQCVEGSRSAECGRARARKALIAMIQNRKSIFTSQERALSPPPPPVTASGSYLPAEQGQVKASSQQTV